MYEIDGNFGYKTNYHILKRLVGFKQSKQVVNKTSTLFGKIIAHENVKSIINRCGQILSKKIHSHVN